MSANDRALSQRDRAGDLVFYAVVVPLVATPPVFDLDVADTALGASTPIAGHQLTETVQKGRTRHGVPAAPVITGAPLGPLAHTTEDLLDLFL